MAAEQQSSCKMTVTGSGILRDGTAYSRTLVVREVIGEDNTVEVTLKT